jgi:hypothetical protein
MKVGAIFLAGLLTLATLWLLAALTLLGRKRVRRDLDRRRGRAKSEEHSGGAVGSAAIYDVAQDVTVIRNRFFYIAEDESEDTSKKVPRTSRPAHGHLIRLIVERDVVTVPAERAGGIDEVLEQGRIDRDDASPGDRFVDAVSEYAGDRIGDSLCRASTQRWVTRDPADVDAVAEALHQSDEWLHDLVDKPVERVANGVGIGTSVSQMIAGISSNFLLEPVSQKLGDAVQFCEIVGIGVGLACALHPLAISCTKSFLHSQLNERLSAEIKEILSDREAMTVEKDAKPESTRALTSGRRTRVLSEVAEDCDWLGWMGSSRTWEKQLDLTEPEGIYCPVEEHEIGLEAS